MRDAAREAALFPVSGLAEVIDRDLRFDDLKDALVQPAIVATDLCDGREVVLRNGPGTGVPSGFPCALTEPPRGALAVALHALTLLIGQRRLHSVEVEVEVEAVAALGVVPDEDGLAHRVAAGHFSGSS